MKGKEIILVIVISFILLGFAFTQVFSLYVVEGDSMQPTFGSCTLLVVDYNFPPEKLVKGDLVIVDISNQVTEIEFDVDKIVHRVVENNIQEKWISTRGDNNQKYEYESSIDGKFSYENILGKVIKFQQLPETIACNPNN